MGRLIILASLLFLPLHAVAENVAGPDKFYVNTEGRYIGIFRDAVDSETRTVTHHAVLPPGAVRVPSRPPGEGMKWDAENRAWATDPDYVPPAPPPPTAMEILNLLVSTGTITEAQKNSLLSGGN